MSKVRRTINLGHGFRTTQTIDSETYFALGCLCYIIRLFWLFIKYTVYFTMIWPVKMLFKGVKKLYSLASRIRNLPLKIFVYVLITIGWITLVLTVGHYIAIQSP